MYILSAMYLYSIQVQSFHRYLHLVCSIVMYFKVYNLLFAPVKIDFPC